MIAEAINRLSPNTEFMQNGEEYSGLEHIKGPGFPSEADVLAEVEVIKAERAKLATKRAGVEFDGVMCSATKEDMWGLNSIKDWVAAGNDTDFEFDNGNVLTLTKDNYAAFESVWIPFRAGFF